MRNAAVALFVAVAVFGAGCASSVEAVPDGPALAEPGPYGVGQTFRQVTDGSRDDRVVGVMAYYPAATDSDTPILDAAPDPSGAPYPVILGDRQIGHVVAAHLASHGFVFLAVALPAVHPLPYWPNTEVLIDMPLDQIAALDDVERSLDHPLGSIADTKRAGVVGFSFGSVLALALSGARYDPAFYEAACADVPEHWSAHWSAYMCGQTQGWPDVLRRASELGLEEADGRRWRALGDERIRAVMPMGPEGFDFFGPDGLADADAAALFVGATADTLNEYEPATTDLFGHYPGADLISFVGADHWMIDRPDAQAQIRRFALAFFGLHLREAKGYAIYLSEEYVENDASGSSEATSFEALVWGVPEP